MVHRNYHNGLKTTLLLGSMWALLLAIGALIASGTGRMVWIVVFAGIGLVQTAYSYWKLCDDCAEVHGRVPGH